MANMAALAEVPSLALDLFGISLPAAIRPSVPLTDDALLEFSRRNKPYKIEMNARGELEIMSPVGGEGSHFEALVVGALTVWAEEGGGIPFGPNGGFRLRDGSVLSPDGAWVASARWEALSREEQQRYPSMCPDFLIEVLSISDSRGVLERKMETWMANGARLAWMIDPYAASVSIYRPGRDVEILDRPDAVEADAVVLGFRLRTSRLWVR